MIGKTRPTISRDEIISKISEADILGYYLGISAIPCLINSPLRKDNKPSFALYSPDGHSVNYRDFATGEKGSCMKLLMQIWHMDRSQVYQKIQNDLLFFKSNIPCAATLKVTHIHNLSNSDLQCKIREWEDFDIQYWESYGISLQWLKYAEVYPISHKFITIDGKTYSFVADKYAYAYVERKEGKVTLKIYQPFNTAGYKWQNKHDKSVISLWTKVPQTGDKLIIASSLKDALCLSCQLHIPAIAIQGEGYLMSKTAIDSLKSRYKNVYISLDTDEPGIINGKKLAEYTGFKNVVPDLGDCKDYSDYYKSLKDKTKFKQLINLFN